MTFLGGSVFTVLLALLGLYNFRRSRQVARSLMALHCSGSCRDTGK